MYSFFEGFLSVDAHFIDKLIILSRVFVNSNRMFVSA